MELSSFSKKVFLIFWEIKLSGTKLKKLVIFEEGTFQPQKKKKKKKKKSTQKKFLMFQEMEVSSLKLRKLLYFF